jgi:hypothetical protein
LSSLTHASICMDAFFIFVIVVIVFGSFCTE